jgi:CBS domain-containing protein
MNVGSICHKNVVTVRPFEELSAAAQLMRQKHVGYLVVVEHDLAEGDARPVGVLTDRDIVVSVIAENADPKALRAGDVMTQKPVTVPESCSVAAALREMRRIGVRRLPVTGQRGELYGVVSLDDVLDTLASELQDVAGSIRNEQRIEGSLRP